MSMRAAILAGLLCIRLSACALSAPVDGSDQLAKAEQLCRSADDPQARLVRQAIEYVELRGYSESDRKTGIYFTNRFKKADEMLKSLPADSPFADLAALWRGRIHYWFGMEGKYESEFQLARGQRQRVDNRRAETGRQILCRRRQRRGFLGENY